MHGNASFGEAAPFFTKRGAHMKIGSVVFAGLILAIGLLYEGMALYMPRGRLSYPGPGLFPVIIGTFLIAMALGCLLQEVLPRKKTGEGPSASPLPNQDSTVPGDRNVKKTFQLIALMVGYTLVLKTLGFPISICAFLVVAIRIFGYHRWFPALAMAAVIAGISYVSFVLWLKVPLPLGILEEILG
jgi:putative tricarboxylic transport membrane protein